MHYLKCIEMLKYALNRLNAGQRKQVPVKVCNDVQMVMLTVQKTLKRELEPMESAMVNDVMEALILAQNSPGLLNLTEEMKSQMVEGIGELTSSISLKAFQYFAVNDFEPTESIIPLMRGVVSCALEKGLV